MKFFVNDIPEDFELYGDLAIDTEAMGLKLNRDRLCLIQICDSRRNIALIHFPESSYDYSCPNLKKYLLDEKNQKIFHFARFDIAIMKYYLNLKEIPNIYCTKIASRFCRTYTESHGLRTLIMELLGIEIKKDQQCSNWGTNDLTESQKSYAKNDVIYLHDLRDILNKMMQNNGRKEIIHKYFSFLNTVTDADIMGFTDDMLNHGYVAK